MFTWITRFIERNPGLHLFSLRVWRFFPPRVAGFLKGLMARNWIVGAVAVMIDEDTSPPEVLLVEHSYRPRGSWGLPGGALESIPGNPKLPRKDASPDDAIVATIKREVWEELGIDTTVIRLIRIDAIPYVEEEPGPYRLDFYFRCVPQQGFVRLRRDLKSGQIKPRSPEVKKMCLVPLTDLRNYDLYSSDVRFLNDDLPRLEPTLNLS